MPPPRKLCEIKAFTLAEVLITLGIIGIVAALTIPSIVSKYEKKQTVVQLKKAYSLLLNAFETAEAEYGSISDWPETYLNNTFDEYHGYENTVFVDKYLMPQLKHYVFKRRNVKMYNLAGKGSIFGDKNWYYLDDGTCFYLYINYSNHGTWHYIFYDTNGDKKPNRFGRDIFVFNFGYAENFKLSLDTDTYQHKQLDDVWRNKQLTDTEGACNKEQTKINGYYAGFSCGAIIRYDGWEIKDDYPW